VKGVSFSAKVVTESNQTLADGNRIVRKSIASIARDSEGRTRREQNLPNAGLTSVVFIQDPAAGVYYVLDARSRAARKITVPSPVETNATVDRASQANPTDIRANL